MEQDLFFAFECRFHSNMRASNLSTMWWRWVATLFAVITQTRGKNRKRARSSRQYRDAAALFMPKSESYSLPQNKWGSQSVLEEWSSWRYLNVWVYHELLFFKNSLNNWNSCMYALLNDHKGTSIVRYSKSSVTIKQRSEMNVVHLYLRCTKVYCSNWIQNYVYVMSCGLTSSSLDCQII